MSAGAAIFRFCVYGMLGWCGEILWTAITRRIRGDVDNWILLGETSLWAFPMYGSAVYLFEPIQQWLSGSNVILRGIAYLGLFWSIEYLGGWLVWKITGKKPWDYSRSPGGSLNGLIRWNFVLVWPFVGLIAERVNATLITLSLQLFQ